MEGGDYMKKLFSAANEYARQSNWKDMALLKFCLFAMGLLVGIRVHEEDKKAAGFLAGLVFFTTYVPLMAKYIGILFGIREDSEEASPIKVTARPIK